MAPHSSIVSWRIPWIEEPGRLQSIRLQELDTTERLSYIDAERLLLKILIPGSHLRDSDLLV